MTPEKPSPSLTALGNQHGSHLDRETFPKLAALPAVGQLQPSTQLALRHHLPSTQPALSQH